MSARTRQACIADADTLAQIYNEGIVDRIATFEVEHRTGGDIKAWLDDPIPVIVAEKDGDVAAFARLSRLPRPRLLFLNPRVFRSMLPAAPVARASAWPSCNAS